MKEGKDFRELILQVFRTRMAFRRSLQRALKKHDTGITFEMLQVLNCLWHQEGLPQQTIANRVAKDKACLTNLLNNLEKKGYVLRKVDTADRRTKYIYLTEEGVGLKQKILPVVDQFYKEAEAAVGKEACQSMLAEQIAMTDALDRL